jgi:hypothetical protein
MTLQPTVRRATAAMALLAALAGAGAGRAAAEAAVEVAGYRYTVTRYGAPRDGQAVAIFVTEPFSDRHRVKVEDPARDPGDTFEALKLNLVRDFQTGIYDYNTMTSVFVRASDFVPAKVSFSSAEWCGHVYEEIRFDQAAVRHSLRSYFEGESGDQTLKPERGGVPEDELPILLRGLRGPYLRPGEKRVVPFLPSAFSRRLTHRELRWSTATIERASRSETVRVPAGSFDALRYEIRPRGGREGTYWIEAAAPHRLLRWTWTGTPAGSRMAADGSETAELTGSERLAYWRLHDNGDEAILSTLGLRPQPGRPGQGSRSSSK